jgi:hypothetical protein
MTLSGCFFKQNEKNVHFELKNNSLSTCDESIIRSVHVSENDNPIGEIYLDKNKYNGNSLIYLSNRNEGYTQNMIFYLNKPNTKYSIGIPRGDISYEINIYTNSEGKIDSVASGNFCN